MNASAGTGTSAATCMFPGCGRLVRERAGDGGGKPPIYCDLVNPATGKLAHTALTAARERARRDKPGGVRSRPISQARRRLAQRGTARWACWNSSGPRESS